MPIIPHRIVERLKQLRSTLDEPQMRRRLLGRADQPNRSPLRSARRATAASIETLWRKIHAIAPAGEEEQRLLADPKTLAAAERYAANIENMIGTVKVPVGVVGPVRINGLAAFYIATGQDAACVSESAIGLFHRAAPVLKMAP